MTKRSNKGLSLLLLLALVLTLTACGKTEAATTPAQETIQVFQEEAASGSTTPLKIADAVLARGHLPFAGVSAEIEPGFLNGFTEEITGFQEGAVFAPAVSAIPFIGYVFRLEDGQDAAAFIEQLEQLADLRWNICTQADEMATDNVGDLVCFVMSPLAFED